LLHLFISCHSFTVFTNSPLAFFSNLALGGQMLAPDPTFLADTISPQPPAPGTFFRFSSICPPPPPIWPHCDVYSLPVFVFLSSIDYPFSFLGDARLLAVSERFCPPLQYPLSLFFAHLESFFSLLSFNKNRSLHVIVLRWVLRLALCFSHFFLPRATP